MLEGIISIVISHTYVLFVGIELSDVIGTSHRVRNADLSATGASIEAKADLFRWSATEFEIVVGHVLNQILALLHSDILKPDCKSAASEM